MTKWLKGETRTLSRQEAEQVLRGWQCVDGEDYCPSCWGALLNKLRQQGCSEENVQFIKEIDAAPVVNYLDFRRCRDGLLVICESCLRTVFVPDKSKIDEEVF